MSLLPKRGGKVWLQTGEFSSRPPFAANAFFRSPGGVSRRAAPPGQPGWFTEGFDTRDLKEAKALLAELA